MIIHFTLNDPPYGTERCFNGLRLALQLLKEEPRPEVTMFLMADAVLCARAGQKTPDGYYNLERMLKGLVRQSPVVLCGACMDARGLGDEELIKGAVRGTMSDLARLTLQANNVLVF